SRRSFLKRTVRAVEEEIGRLSILGRLFDPADTERLEVLDEAISKGIGQGLVVVERDVNAPRRAPYPPGRIDGNLKSKRRSIETRLASQGFAHTPFGIAQCAARWSRKKHFGMINRLGELVPRQAGRRREPLLEPLDCLMGV